MDAITALKTRASAGRLSAPAPSPDHLATIIDCAVNAPDHGRIRPWRFVVIEGEALRRFGDAVADATARKDPAATPEFLDVQRNKALRAPMILAIAARVSPGKIPPVEQVLAAGAAAQNVMLAAHALGYGCMWKTGMPAYDEGVKQAIGLQPTDQVVGYMYLGTPEGQQPSFPRATAEGVVARM